MLASRAVPVVLGVVVSACAADAAAQNPLPSLKGYVTLASAYWDHGFAQNDGATLEVGIDYERPSGFFVGARAANVDYAIDFSHTRPRDLEVEAYAGYHRRLANWSWTATLGRYAYPGSAVDYDYNQIGGSVGVRDRFFYTASYTNDFYGLERSALNQEVSFVQPLHGDVEIGAALGHFRVRSTNVSFTHWNVGASKVLRRFVLDLRYYDSAYRSLSYLGDPSDAVVLSISYALSLRRDR